MLRGTAASSGIGIGQAVRIRSAEIEVIERTVLDTSKEQQRFLAAIEKCVSELEQAREVVLHNIGEQEAAIFDAHIAIVHDQEMLNEVLRMIERKRLNAEYAFRMICNGYIALFSHMEDELMAARAADFADLRDRVLSILLGLHSAELGSIPEGSVLIAEDILPSQSAAIDPKQVAGIAMSRGTKFSHIAILARALGIPTIVAVPTLFETVQNGDTIILDGNSGLIWVNPNEARLKAYQLHLRNQAILQEKLAIFREQPTVTADGKPFALRANMAVQQELEEILHSGADGIGLYRSEFVFMDCSEAPDEETQYRQYQRVVQLMKGKPVIIRTLDVGGDKIIPYLDFDEEMNSFLGYRAIRFCFDHPDFFKTQLRAILRSAVHGDVRIMLPMVNDLSELRCAKALIRGAAQELEVRGEAYAADIPIGIMIETPSAALCAPELAAEADFFSIGTNDLTQYTLAVDRTSSNIATLYDPLHPSVLRLIDLTVKAAHKAGITVCVCGEAAADPYMLSFLLGCGIDGVSVNAGSILFVRSMLSRLSYAEWRERVEDILALCSPDEVRAYVGTHSGV